MSTQCPTCGARVGFGGGVNFPEYYRGGTYVNVSSPKAKVTFDRYNPDHMKRMGDWLEEQRVAFEGWHNSCYGTVGVRSLQRYPDETGLGYMDEAVQAQYHLWCELHPMKDLVVT